MNDIRYTGKFDLSPIRKDGDHTIAIRVANPYDVIFHHHNGVNFISGPIADKLYAYESLGYSPEEMEKIIRELRARRQVANTVYGKTAVDRMQAIADYVSHDIEMTKKFVNVLHGDPDFRMKIKKVIFHDPATIVFWMDGSKTVVKCTNEAYDREKGLAMAISKRALGDKGNYYEVFKKYLKEDKK